MNVRIVFLILLFFGVSVLDVLSQSSYGSRKKHISSMDELISHWPAYRLAEEGKFASAWACVERGEDTQAHYNQGVRYYNYWAPRTPSRTPEGKPDPTMGDVLNDINEDTIAKNEELMQHYQTEAKKGNKEAQEMVDKYGPRVDVARRVQDKIVNLRNKDNSSKKPTSDERSEPITGELYPQTRTRELSINDIQNWSDGQLRYAINEMYARHGLVFSNKDIQAYFMRFAWYNANVEITTDQIEKAFSKVEFANMQTLSAKRRAIEFEH